MFSSFVFFNIFTMACAVAPNWPSFLIFRLLSGICASSAIAVIGGLYADIYNNPVARGRAMAIFMAVSWGWLASKGRADSFRRLPAGLNWLL